MNKSTILLMLSVSLPVLLAESNVVAPATLTREASVDQVALMQKQIADLQKQLAVIASQVKERDQRRKEHHHSKEECHHAKETHTAVVEPKQGSYAQFDKGYTAVPGTTLGVKIGGMVKLDMIYDGKSNTSEQTSISRLPYDLTVNQGVTNVGYSWKKHFYMHAKQTKLRIDSVAKNSSGRDIKAHIEGDFFGSTNWGDAVVNGATVLSTIYTFRLRHAVLAYAGLEAGHTATTFHLEEAILPSVDLNGIDGGINRHALIRYTHKLGNFGLTAAAEHSRPDYVRFVNNNATVRYTYNPQDSGIGKPERPDLILKVKYSFNNGSAIGFSGVYRDLQLKSNSGSDDRNYRVTGQGVNLAAKIMTFGKSFFTGGVATGRGIGWYIAEANGRSAFLDQTKGCKAIPMTMFWAGYCQVWNPQWQTSIGVARIELNTTSFNNDVLNTTTYAVNDPGIDRTFNKFLINTMYRPEENLEFGLEYFYLQRKSVNTNRGVGVNAANGADSNTGTGHRFQFATSYKF